MLPPTPPIRHPRQITPILSCPLNLLRSLNDRIRHRRLSAGIMPRVRRFDHLREVPRPLVEEERSDEVAATASVDLQSEGSGQYSIGDIVLELRRSYMYDRAITYPFEAVFFRRGSGEGGVGVGYVVLFGQTIQMVSLPYLFGGEG